MKCPCLSKLALLNKFLEAVHNPRPNGTCEIKKRGGFIREIVAMAPRREFFSSKRK